MLKKWGPAVLLFGAIVALILWTKCFETPIEHHEATTESELRAVAISVVGEQRVEKPWMGDSNGDYLAVLIEEAREAVEIGADLDAMRRIANKRTLLGLRVFERGYVPEGRTSLVDRVTIYIAVIACATVLDDKRTATQYAMQADEVTRSALKTASTIDHWGESSAARLMFVESLDKIRSGSKWPPAVLLQMSPGWGHDTHRSSLARVIKLNLFDPIAYDIANASERKDLANVVAENIFDEQTEDQTALVSVLLHRHTRAFSPKQTVLSMSQSVKELSAALTGPWSQCERVLDLVSESQAIWIEFEDMLEKSDVEATAAIKALKPKIDTAENPVGLAILNRERLSWSSSVQSAYVADAKEAMAKIANLKGTKDFDPDTILDPLTGGTFDLTRAKPRSTLNQTGEKYAFVRAFVEMSKIEKP